MSRKPENPKATPKATMSAETVTKKPRVGPVTFFNQVNQEARKVTWTTRKETIAATIMVAIMVIVSSLFFALTDTLVQLAVSFITNIKQQP
jgi:preprotein translocase subunit SecE